MQLWQAIFLVARPRGANLRTWPVFYFFLFLYLFFFLINFHVELILFWRF